MKAIFIIYSIVCSVIVSAGLLAGVIGVCLAVFCEVEDTDV